MHRKRRRTDISERKQPLHNPQRAIISLLPLEWGAQVHRLLCRPPYQVSHPIGLVSQKGLASITSPYHPEQPQIQGQSKNYHAQTLKLGERLRLGREDLKNSTDRTQQALLVHPVAHPRRICLVMGHQCLPYRCLPTLFHLVSRRPRIGLGNQLVAPREDRARKENGSNGDPIHFRVGVIDDNHLFVRHTFPSTGARRKSRRPREEDCWILPVSSDLCKAPKVRLPRLEDPNFSPSLLLAHNYLIRLFLFAHA
jgi:hypothetical protein